VTVKLSMREGEVVEGRKCRKAAGKVAGRSKRKLPLPTWFSAALMEVEVKAKAKEEELDYMSLPGTIAIIMQLSSMKYTQPQPVTLIHCPACPQAQLILCRTSRRRNACARDIEDVQHSRGIAPAS
jgi:hypothetical protein